MKSSTDLHWDKRADSVKDDFEVNIMDIFQRDLEYEYICKNLQKDMTVLEVGCGNGFSTSRFRTYVKQVDAFDYSENMIERAKANFGETNNRFILDNVLCPKNLKDTYDLVICVRVLINLANLKQQIIALRNLVPFVKPNGRFILLEGFTEGFTSLNKLHDKLGIPPIKPAKINYYSSLSDLLPELLKDFKIEDQFHLGAYDFLTRVVYPLIAGPENVKHNTVFSEKSSLLASHFNPVAFKDLSRIQGFVFRKS